MNKASLKGGASFGSLALTLLALCVALGNGGIAVADVKLPAVFSDHMVLQRDAALPVWGYADPGEEVTVSIAGQSKTATADKDGKWTVKLDKLSPGEPCALTVKGKNTLTVADVLVGEVWLCSGQSNMAFKVSSAQDFDKEKAAANLPQVRMFTTAGNAPATPQPDCKGAWQVCAPETVGDFSATAYFFGRELHKTLGVPVGLINSSVGGTPIESWTSKEAQQQCAELKPLLEAQAKAEAAFDPVAAQAQYEKALARWKAAAAKAKADGKQPSRAPRNPVEIWKRRGGVGGLFNGMIAPLVPYAIRGAIWYQGEANSSQEKAPFYQYQLPLLVQDWRARWGQGDFPFAWVQLPNFNAPQRNWPLVREAMLKSLKVPNTGMAIAVDVGEPGNIHPKNKQEVGKRLSLWALGAVYGQKTATSGPLPAGHEVRGGEVALSFTHTDGGLTAKDGELKGFLIAGEDKKWAPAKARIEGDKVIVSSPDVKQPVAVRYAWENNPDGNLFNGAGLPASPFRTDDWQ